MTDANESPDRQMLRPMLDCHTHIGVSSTHVGQAAQSNLSTAWGSPLWDVDLDEHSRAMQCADRAIVLAFDAPRIGIVVPNEYVSQYVQSQSGLVGFASVDPNRADAPNILDKAITELGMLGLKLGPIYQHFHPHDSCVADLLEVADHHRIPVLWHQGATFVSDAPLEVARPALLDAQARRFPELTMWVAHLGHPWCEETMVLIRKHENVYTDVSANFRRPMQMYWGLVSALEYRVLDKLLFGSDYPFADIPESIAGIMAVNEVVHGTALPRIPVEDLHRIIVQDGLELIGLGDRVT